MESFCATTVQTFFHLKPSSSFSPPSYSAVSFLKSHFKQSPLTHSSRQFSRRTNSTPFVASAAPATADGAVSDKLPADLIVTETPEPNSRVKLSVEVPAEVCEDCYRRVMREFTKQAKHLLDSICLEDTVEFCQLIIFEIPGFRPGKNVPESILISYIGKETVKGATIESILKRTLPHALSSVSGKALEDSIRISTKFSEMESSFSSMKSLRYDIFVDVAPEVKWNPEDGYKNLKVVVEIDKEIDAQTAAEQELRRRHKALGALKIVVDRGLQIGDVAILDISAATIEQDESKAKSIPSAESKGFRFDTEDEDKVLPDFMNSIAGIKRDETKTFPYTFPDTWEQEDLRGVRALFTVKETLLQKFLEVEQTAKEQAADNAILDQLHKMVEVDIPPSLFEEQGRQLYGAQLLQIQANMKLNEKQLEALSSPKAVKDFLENQRENITNIIKQNLAVGDIFKRENLQIVTDEIVKEVENSIDEFKRHNQEYDEERVREQVREVLEGAKVLEWLKERADIQFITK
ncbi:hypothetical protein SASPL_132892 [Salvia splendens]|uniref:peptidylprolyl isomerase n=1 Tax=Salvia splendens TaxID=180675 RepID=A0A8X8X3W0_SALSN|nr:hypothetical protein SASPL_132892 [Salvia splendens]